MRYKVKRTAGHDFIVVDTETDGVVGNVFALQDDAEAEMLMLEAEHETNSEPVHLKRDKRPWIICPKCEGEGKIVHPACSVWTGEDIAEDPDGFEFMMEGGLDVSCPICHGSGKIRESTEEEIEAEAERMADRHTRAMENGDYEAANNPDMLRHYY